MNDTVDGVVVERSEFKVLQEGERISLAEAEIAIVLEKYGVGFSYRAVYQDGRLLEGTVLVVPFTQSVSLNVKE